MYTPPFDSTFRERYLGFRVTRRTVRRDIERTSGERTGTSENAVGLNGGVVTGRGLRRRRVPPTRRAPDYDDSAAAACVTRTRRGENPAHAVVSRVVFWRSPQSIFRRAYRSNRRIGRQNSRTSVSVADDARSPGGKGPVLKSENK